MKKISVPSRAGVDFVGRYNNPDDKSDTPIVLIAHGSNSSKDLASTSVIAQDKLNEIGLATFAFDAYGSGESGGDRSDVTLSKDIQGIKDIIIFLRTEMGHSSVSALGSSYGGATTLLTAAQVDPPLGCLVLRAPVSNFQKLEEERLGKSGIEKWKKIGVTPWPGKADPNLQVGYEFYEDSKKFDGWKVARLVKCPVLIVHGDKDQAVPIHQSQKLVKLLPNGELLTMKGAGHVFSEGTAYQDSMDKIIDFFKKNLT